MIYLKGGVYMWNDIIESVNLDGEFENLYKICDKDMNKNEEKTEE